MDFERNLKQGFFTYLQLTSNYTFPIKVYDLFYLEMNSVTEDNLFYEKDILIRSFFQGK